jgi:hypothetical protein
MVARPHVEIEGLKDIQKKLRDLDPALAKELKTVNLTVADMVADIARAKVPTRSGKARSTVKAKGEQRFAVIKAGGRKAPYYPWLDFGGQAGHKSGNAIGDRGKRPFIREGRYIYSTVGTYHSKIVHEYVVMLGALLDKAGL